MCHLYDLARHNMPWLEDWLWLCLALAALLALAGLAVWAPAREGRWKVSFRVYVDGQLGLSFQTREDAEEAAQGFRAEGFDAYVVLSGGPAGADIGLDHDLPPLPPLTDGRSDRERELGAELVRRREAGERDGDLPRLLAEAEAAREAGEGGGG